MEYMFQGKVKLDFFKYYMIFTWHRSKHKDREMLKGKEWEKMYQEASRYDYIKLGWSRS